MKLVHEYLTTAAQLYPYKTAVICKDWRCTYQQLDDLSTTFALSLIEMTFMARGLSGRRVAILTGNTIETVVAMYGIMKVGGTFVIINPSSKPVKIAQILNNCSCSIVVAPLGKVPAIDQIADKLSSTVDLIVTGDLTYETKIRNSKIIQHSYDQIYSNDRISEKTRYLRQKALPSIKDDSIATLIYTSGSTGEPKGVLSPHHAIVAATTSIIQYLENTADDIVLNVMPLAYGYGLYQVIMAVMYGGTIILEDGVTFAPQILQTIAKENVTGFPLLSTISALVLKVPSYATYMRQLRYITSAGGVFPVDHIKAFRETLPDTKLFSMYGLTECMRVCYLDPSLIDIKPTSVGKAISCCEVKIVDSDFNEVLPNTVGELVISGDNLMGGYWNEPQKTASTFRVIYGVRYLFSGDCFKMDEDGDLYYISRKDDLFKVNGYRISPKEIEDIMLTLEGVVQAVVKPIPDPVAGNVVGLHIVASKKLTEIQVRKHCYMYLESFMMPRTIKFWEAFPVSDNGKVDRKSIL